MTKRDLFIVFIKLFSLYLFISTPFTIVPVFTSLSMMGIGFFPYLFIILALMVLIAVFFLIVVNADKIADKLKLHKGFDDDRVIIGQLSPTDIFRSTIVVLGLYLMVISFPELLTAGLRYFVSTLSPQNEFEEPFSFNYNTAANYDYLTYIIELIIGYVMIVKHKSIAQIFNDKQEETAKSEDVLDAE